MKRYIQALQGDAVLGDESSSPDELFCSALKRTKYNSLPANVQEEVTRMIASDKGKECLCTSGKTCALQLKSIVELKSVVEPCESHNLLNSLAKAEKILDTLPPCPQPPLKAPIISSSIVCNPTSENLLFHLQKLDSSDQNFKSLSAEFSQKGFEVDSVYNVCNEYSKGQFEWRRKLLIKMRGCDNVKRLYHTTKGDLFQLFQMGLDYRLAQRGFFGKALYFSDDPMKANDYSMSKGNPDCVRVMLVCHVALGLTKNFEVGRFDRDLVMEPPGFDSIQGFIRRGSEFAVFSSNSVCITQMVMYRCRDSVLELAPSLTVPKVTGQVVFITASLSEFFGKLQSRAGSETSAEGLAVKRAVGRLLKSHWSAEEFLKEVSAIFKAEPPANLLDKLKIELSKSKLPSSPAQALSPQTAAYGTFSSGSSDGSGSSGSSNSSVVQLVPEAKPPSLVTAAPLRLFSRAGYATGGVDDSMDSPTSPGGLYRGVGVPGPGLLQPSFVPETATGSFDPFVNDRRVSLNRGATTTKENCGATTIAATTIPSVNPVTTSAAMTTATRHYGALPTSTLLNQHYGATTTKNYGVPTSTSITPAEMLLRADRLGGLVRAALGMAPPLIKGELHSPHKGKLAYGKTGLYGGLVRSDSWAGGAGSAAWD